MILQKERSNTPLSFCTSMKFLVLAVIILSLSSKEIFAAAPEKGVGVNLNSIADWAPATVFVDIMKSARKWHSKRQGVEMFDTGEPLQLKDGWISRFKPGQYAESMMSWGRGTETIPAGTYDLFYRGKGKFKFIHDARIISQDENSARIKISPKKGIAFQLLESDPEDPLRDFSLIMPGHKNTYLKQPFNQDYISYLEKFDFRVVRFMDWMATNNSPLVSWENRTKKNTFSQASKHGVAYEYIYEFSNILNVAPWITIPHMADNSYVQKLARLFKDNLAPSLNVYVEYSNETWNGGFSQTNYQKIMADENGLGEGYKYYVKRSSEVMEIFEQVFGSSDRLVRIISGQFVNTWRNGQILKEAASYGNFDAFAIAPYFGHAVGEKMKALKQVEQLTNEQTIAKLLHESLSEWEKSVRGNVALSEKYDLPLISYEAGQHITGQLYGVPICTSLNNSPAMYDIYREMLTKWQKLTGDALFMQFSGISNYGNSGCWGMAQTLQKNAPQTPKERAVFDQYNQK